MLLVEGKSSYAYLWIYALLPLGWGQNVSDTAQTKSVNVPTDGDCKSLKKADDNIVLITNDKFCAGYTNGTSVCNGDSGGGLVFQKDDKWFVTGMVSVGVGVDFDYGEKTCDGYSYTLYTSVPVYADWILEVISTMEQRNQSSVATPAATSFCLVPPQPTNGEWKLDLSFCADELNCNITQGAELKPGSRLVYGCDPGYVVNGNSSVYCEERGNWSSVPECVLEGDSCSLTDGGSGICITLKNCPRLLQKIVAGKNSPHKICRFAGFEPIVCCPSSNLIGNSRGEISRQKCREYAQYVYIKKYPLGSNHRPINISQCAIKSQKLIVGGVRAERMEFPHMAAIGFNNKDGSITWRCGGTLISETFVLTVANCLYSPTWGNATWVRVGDLNLIRTDDGATPEERRISERIKHPDYNPPAEYHDIALLRLESRVPFNGWIRPACLHTAPSTRTPKAVATGWGDVEWADDEGSNDLLKVTLPLVDQPTCNAKYTGDTKLPDGVVGDWSICAGEVGKDTCRGDGGGPLVIFSKPEYYCMYDVVGVTSLGRLCGSVIPGIYTRVYYYVPWIEATVWGRG